MKCNFKMEMYKKSTPVQRYKPSNEERRVMFYNLIDLKIWQRFQQKLKEEKSITPISLPNDNKSIVASTTPSSSKRPKFLTLNGKKIMSQSQYKRYRKQLLRKLAN